MGMTSDEATTFAAHYCKIANAVTKASPSRRVDRGRPKRPDARPPLRFRLEAARTLRGLAGWVGRVHKKAWAALIPPPQPLSQRCRPATAVIEVPDALRSARVSWRR